MISRTNSTLQRRGLMAGQSVGIPMNIARSSGGAPSAVPAIVPAGRRDKVGRKFLHAFVHFFAYRFVLSRKWQQHVRAAGFRLDVAPTVFHPKIFRISE